jgi:hypothetical protein
MPVAARRQQVATVPRRRVYPPLVCRTAAPARGAVVLAIVTEAASRPAMVA